uniref:Uncharacterized protein n=1 Tax=Solanum tuberosum TaxID=4113 RepID=M1B6Z4_SOLTU
MEVHEWLENGLQLNCDHSYLPAIFYLIERCLGIYLQKRGNTMNGFAHKLQFNCNLTFPPLILFQDVKSQIH